MSVSADSALQCTVSSGSAVLDEAGLVSSEALLERAGVGTCRRVGVEDLKWFGARPGESLTNNNNKSS